MTVSYAGEVPNGSSFGVFWKILFKWVWKNLISKQNNCEITICQNLAGVFGTLLFSSSGSACSVPIYYFQNQYQDDYLYIVIFFDFLK